MSVPVSSCAARAEKQAGESRCLDAHILAAANLFQQRIKRGTQRVASRQPLDARGALVATIT
jgi:hypothetical protein